MINHTTFEQRLGYQIGVKLAQEAYSREKTASMQAFRTLGSGLKGVATGQGGTVSQAFQAGAGQGFKQTMGQIRSGFAEPWKQMYRGYTSRGAQAAKDNMKSSITNLRNARGELTSLQNSGASQGAIDSARAAVTNATAARDAARQAIQARGGISNVNRMATYTGRPLTGADYATMAAGTALGAGALYGGYNMARSAVGANTPQQQVAPHQYYMNQLSSYFS